MILLQDIYNELPRKKRLFLKFVIRQWFSYWFIKSIDFALVQCFFRSKTRFFKLSGTFLMNKRISKLRVSKKFAEVIIFSPTLLFYVFISGRACFKKDLQMKKNDSFEFIAVYKEGENHSAIEKNVKTNSGSNTIAYTSSDEKSEITENKLVGMDKKLNLNAVRVTCVIKSMKHALCS